MKKILAVLAVLFGTACFADAGFFHWLQDHRAVNLVHRQARMNRIQARQAFRAGVQTAPAKEAPKEAPKALPEAPKAK